MGKYLERAMSELLAAAFSGASEEEIDAMGKSILEEELTNLTEKSYEKTVSMKATKVEGKWKVAKIEDDSEFMNAMLGGLVDVVKAFEELGNSMDGK